MTSFEHLFTKEELQQMSQKDIVTRINQWYQHNENKTSIRTDVSKASTPQLQNQKKQVSGAASNPPPFPTDSSLPASSSNTGIQE